MLLNSRDFVVCAIDAKERGPQYPAISGGYIVATRP